MNIHKYTVGQSVQFTPGPQDGAAQPGRYTVMRQLPGDDYDLQYRVKGTAEAHERVVRESQLRR